MDPEPVSAHAERLLYYALVGALEAGLVRAAEDALTVLREANQPLGPMGAEWLAMQRSAPICRPVTRMFTGILNGPSSAASSTCRSGWRLRGSV
jgi:hypothetical protein